MLRSSGVCKICIGFFSLSLLYSLSHHFLDDTFCICIASDSLLAACLTSSNMQVCQGQTCLDRFTCCHTEMKVADKICHLTLSQYCDTGPSSPNTPLRWPSGEGTGLESGRSGVRVQLVLWYFPRWGHTSDLKIGTPVASLPGAWRYRVSAGTGWPGVNIL